MKCPTYFPANDKIEDRVRNFPANKYHRQAYPDQHQCSSSMHSNQNTMETTEIVVLNLLQLLLAFLVKHKQAVKKLHRRRRRTWVKEFIRKRHHLGATNCIMAELADKHPTDFVRYLRMDLTTFKELVELVKVIQN